MYIAAKFGHLDMLKLLIETYHCSPSVCDSNGTSPAEVAGLQQKFGCMEYLSSLPTFVAPEPADIVRFINKLNDNYLSFEE